MNSETALINKVKHHFKKAFGSTGRSILVRSPGRINLIGEHTDYNEGFVLPSAIDRAIYLEIAPRKDSQANIYSIDFERSHSFDLNDPIEKGPAWANYVLGVIEQFTKKGNRLTGFDCAYAGDIPIGAGISSSAAVEAGFAFALNELNKCGADRRELARIAQRAENEFVGVACGIMDQFANLLSKGRSALFLDCRNLEVEYIPFDGYDLSFVLCDTGVKHELASTEYNLRRQQCESGMKILRKHFQSILSLRDVSTEMLQGHAKEIDPVAYKRCKYVLEENRRVIEGCESLRRDDYENFGRLLYESHKGLRDEYEVSCAELDVLVEAASGSRGVLGSRMMGGGFGGCTLNLVEFGAVGEMSEHIKSVYSRKMGRVPNVYSCSLTSGTELVNLQGRSD